MNDAIYVGPGKVNFNAVAFQPEGTNGAVALRYNEETSQVESGMFGRMGEQEVDQTVELTTRPFDDWGLVPVLFPARVGATTSAAAAALAVSSRAHGTGAAVPATVWRPEGVLYTVLRAGIVGHPTLHLGVGKALFDTVRLVGIGVAGVAMGAPGYLMDPPTESGAADPGYAMTLADFVREAWTGVWGSVAGFGGANNVFGNNNPVQAEDEWTIQNEIRYSAFKCQGRTLGFKLDSAAFMARCRPFGPGHTDILAAVAAHAHGELLGLADLTLTSALSAKTITLKNADIKGAGFEFGGTTLGTGEVGFVNSMQFTAGAPTALIEFSA